MPSRSPSGGADDAPAGPNDREVATARALRARLEEDRQTVERLAAAGFAGPEFDRFEMDLVARGYRTMDRWTLSRLIFQRCADRNIHLTPQDWTADDRADLVQDTVATGYRRFRDGALLRREWSPAGGATLRTYFTANLIFCFSEKYRAWQTAAITRRLQQRELTPEMGLVLADPAQRVGAVVVDRDTIMRALRSLDPRLAKIVVLAAESYTQKEIAEQLADGTTSRAVEGMLRRHRLNPPGKEPRP